MVKLKTFILLGTVIFLFIHPVQGKDTASLGTLGYFEPSASFLGNLDYERVGYNMNGIGDVNNDGYEDFLIGTFHNKTKGHDAGAAYLLLGNPSNIWGYNKSLSLADARFIGKEAYDALGYWVAGRGDVNGDGYDDFIIGAPAGNEEGGPKPGEAYVIFGKSATNWGYNFIPEDNANASYIGHYAYDHCGQSVAIVGDVNKDGLDDFIISSPYNDEGGTDAGKIYFILGKSAGWSLNTPVQNATASFVAGNYSGLAGYSCAQAGDVNGDGCPDFLIGSPYDTQVGDKAGKVYLIFGRTNVNWGTNFNLENADVKFLGEAASDRAGWTVAGAGDVNNDGFSDILIGAWGKIINNRSGVGKAYLILGKASGWKSQTSLSEAQASWIGTTTDENVGWGISGLQDYNGDGYDEILIGAWKNDDEGKDSGKMWVIFGKQQGWTQNVDLKTVNDFFFGDNDGDYAGYAVAGADMNGDGLGDILTSATYNSEAGYWAGKIYLFLSERSYFPIQGVVGYYSDQSPVANVVMNVTGGEVSSTTTQADGSYSRLLYRNKNYTITPAKTVNEDVGQFTVLGYDAALTARASIKLIDLTDSQAIAANVDCDTGVTVYDASLIAQYVVDLPKPTASHVGEWRFIPTSRTYQNLTKEQKNQDYDAVILGNVNGVWYKPTLMPKIANVYDIGKYMASKEYQIGDEIRVPFMLEPRDQGVLSLDLEIVYPASLLKLMTIEKSALLHDFNMMTNETAGLLRLCTYGLEEINDNGLLVELVFQIINQEKAVAEIDVPHFQINDNAPATAKLLLPLNEKNIQIGSFKLHQNYPNPFSGEGGVGQAATVLYYDIPTSGKITCKIYNILGQQVKFLEETMKEAGTHVMYWDGRDDAGNRLPNGIYLANLRYNEKSKIIRMVKM